jgi:glycosyltransferase involved in cell wall biosynthesis
MRILVVTNLHPSPAHPAFGTFVAARIDALRALGNEVEVVAIRDPAVHRRIAAKYASLALTAGARAVADRLRRRRVDVVEAHIAYPTGLIARPVAWLLGAPLVLFAHGADVLDIPTRSKRHGQLARRTYGAARLVIANSTFLATEIQRRYPKVGPRVRVISPGIETALFEGDGGSDTPRSGILFVGRLVPDKGVDVLIQAVAGLGGTAVTDTATEARTTPRLTVIGDGPERERLAAAAAASGIDLVLTGPLDRAQVAAAMRAAAVVAVPSVYREPLGLVAIEAMAAGAIVVASATGGLPETVVDGGTGFLVPPGDVAALTDALRRALELAGDPVAAGPIRGAALAVARRHDVARSAAASVALYGTLRR